MSKHGLTAEEAKGLTDESIDKIEIIAKRTNTSVKDLIKQINSSRINGEEKQ